MASVEKSGESGHDAHTSRVQDESLLAKVLTVSDGVVEGVREDRSGEALVATLASYDYDVVEHRVVADGVDSLADSLSEMSNGFA